MSGWSVLFWLVVTFVIMYPLKRWISAHVQGVAFLLTGNPQAAMWVYWVLFLPGTFLHEISHWLTAKILRVKTVKFSLWPQKRRGQLQMGAVQVQVNDPFRHSLIGLAPLIFGSVAVLIIGQGRLHLTELGVAINTGDIEIIWNVMVGILTTPDIWLWLYLIFAISNAMLPSASDRESWWSVLIYLGIALFLAIGLGLNPTISPELQDFGLAIISGLLYAYLITIFVDIFFIVAIFLIETFFAWILGRQVQYNR
jgi:hypothetical protein